jgi:hypothetical protein
MQDINKLELVKGLLSTVQYCAEAARDLAKDGADGKIVRPGAISQQSLALVYAADAIPGLIPEESWPHITELACVGELAAKLPEDFSFPNAIRALRAAWTVDDFQGCYDRALDLWVALNSVTEIQRKLEEMTK